MVRATERWVRVAGRQQLLPELARPAPGPRVDGVDGRLEQHQRPHQVRTAYGERQRDLATGAPADDHGRSGVQLGQQGADVVQLVLEVDVLGSPPPPAAVVAPPVEGDAPPDRGQLAAESAQKTAAPGLPWIPRIGAPAPISS